MADFLFYKLEVDSLLRSHDPHHQGKGWSQYSSAAIELLGLCGGESVLERGCGSGWFAASLCSRVSYLTVIDPILKAVNECQCKCLQSNRKRGSISYCVAIGEELPFKPGSFDIVVFWASYHHLHNSIAALKEARKALKSKGRLLLFEYVLPEECKAEWLEIARMKDPSTKHVYSYQELVSDIRDAGFYSFVKQSFLHQWDAGRWMHSVLSAGLRDNITKAIINTSENLKNAMRINVSNSSLAFTYEYNVLLASSCDQLHNVER